MVAAMTIESQTQAGGGDDGLVGVIDFPREWVGLSRFTRTEIVASADVKGGKALLVMAMLSDDSNLMALCYPGGQAALRIARMANTVESRFSGRKPSVDPLTEKMWGIAVESMHAALEKTRDELGR
jgi:hypothetical protein